MKLRNVLVCHWCPPMCPVELAEELFRGFQFGGTNSSIGSPASSNQAISVSAKYGSQLEEPASDKKRSAGSKVGIAAADASRSIGKIGLFTVSLRASHKLQLSASGMILHRRNAHKA